MAEAGLIALDPARLSGLEVYLQGLGDGCRRRAVRVADEVADSGLSAAHPVAELERLAVTCQRERDDVAWRRAVVEALPHDLPLTGRTYPTRAAAQVAAEALADDVIDALRDDPPHWGRLARLLAELDRSAGSPPFVAAFFVAIGPVRARDLPLVLERAWSMGPDAAATEAEPGAVLAAQTSLADALRTASRVPGPAALGEQWCRAYASLPSTDADLAAEAEAATAIQRREADEVQRSLLRAGYGFALAARIAESVGWRRAAAALTVDRGVLGLVAAPLALADGDGVACDGPEAVLRTAAAGVTIIGAVAPVTAGPATLAAGVLSGLALLFDACRRQDPRPNETHPTIDPATGQSRVPSGHQTNSHVDVAGVPLPPSYG
ncbi:MAG TPA: hypothetical protein VF228_19985 [Iamia sp.]